MLSPTLTDILTAGIQAPSADNHHHLRFEPTANGIRLWSEQERMIGLSGYKRTLDLISLGAVIENVVLQASSHQIHADLQLFPGPSADLIAEIVLTPTDDAPDPLCTAIPYRHTNRKFFTGPPADTKTLKSITEAAGAIPGCLLVWMDSPESRRKILSLIRHAEGERFRQKALHAEMFDNIRFDIGWNASCDEGLPPGALEVEKPLRPFFEPMKHWSVMRFLNLIGAYQMLGWRAGDLPCRTASHLGLITIDNTSDRSQLSAGRAFQRAWLSATKHQLALQPMPASALYAHDTAHQQDIPNAVKTALLKGYNSLQLERTPVMVFRIGHAPPPKTVSMRKPLTHYCLSAP